MSLRSLDLPTLRAAWWAHRSLRIVRSDLRRNGLAYRPAPRPPDLPPRAGRGVLAVFRRQSHTCLERALVLQRWEATQGVGRDVVVGVTSASAFAAHAWLDGEPDGEVGSYAELMRLPPP
jgi:hypothetical protein